MIANVINLFKCQPHKMINHTLERVLPFCGIGAYRVKDTMKAYLTNVIRCSRLRLLVGYFIYLEFTPVFFYLIY